MVLAETPSLVSAPEACPAFVSTTSLLGLRFLVGIPGDALRTLPELDEEVDPFALRVCVMECSRVVCAGRRGIDLALGTSTGGFRTGPTAS